VLITAELKAKLGSSGVELASFRDL
jgi:hypothetical protein